MVLALPQWLGGWPQVLARQPVPGPVLLGFSMVLALALDVRSDAFDFWRRFIGGLGGLLA